MTGELLILWPSELSVPSKNRDEVGRRERAVGAEMGTLIQREQIKATKRGRMITMEPGNKEKETREATEDARVEDENRRGGLGGML